MSNSFAYDLIKRAGIGNKFDPRGVCWCEEREGEEGMMKIKELDFIFLF
jgi:hypothetical protein